MTLSASCSTETVLTYPCSYLVVLEVAGTDAASFLHNQTTQDITSLSVEQGCWASAVDRQGKIKGLFSCWKRSDDCFWLLLEQEQCEALISHFEMFRIMAQVTFTVLELPVNYIYSNNLTFLSESSVTALMSSVTLSDTSTVLFQESGTCSGLGLAGFIIGDTSDIERFKDAQMLDATSFNRMHLEAGLLRFGVDYDHDTMLPETGYETRAVSYDKGCYLGQEVIARIKTYGSPQKHTSGVVFAEPLTEAFSVPAALMLDGKTIGSLRSHCYSEPLDAWIGVAYLNKAHRTAGQTLSVLIEDKPVSLRVKTLPFIENASTGSVLGLDSKLGEAKLQAGLTAFSKGDDTSAIASLREAVALLPADHDEALNAKEALGAILGRQPDAFEDTPTLNEAIALMESIIEAEPNHIMAHTNLSIYWLRKGDKDKAEELKAQATIAKMRNAAKASGFDLGKLDAERKAQEEAKQKQMEERVTMFQDALKFNPEDALGNFGLASALLELNRYEEAIPAFEKTIAAQPKHSVAYLSLGKSLEATKELEKAKETYKKGIQVASERGDLMPLKEMEQRLDRI